VVFCQGGAHLRGGPALGQAQLEVILHGREEVLEAFGGSVQEALQERLLVTEKRREHEDRCQPASCAS